MARGDHLIVKRNYGPIAYWHHGVDIGDGTVIHYFHSTAKKTAGVVKRVKLKTFAKGQPILVYPLPGDDPKVIVSRAKSRLGEKTYSALEWNCEHFVEYCRQGRAGSDQAKTIKSLSSILAIALLAPVTLGAAVVLGAVSIYDHVNLDDKLIPLEQWNNDIKLRAYYDETLRGAGGGGD